MALKLPDLKGVLMKTLASWQSEFSYLLPIFLVTLSVCSANEATSRKVSIVFRFDDYSSTSNTEIETSVIGVFRRNRSSMTVGVIPYVCARDPQDPSPQDVIPLSERKADILRSAVEDGVVDVALHGYSHQTTTDRKPCHEFTGLDYDSQLERLSKGRELLERITGVTIGTFIPPWNSYDMNTIRAMEALNFSVLSADWSGTVYEKSKLGFLPCSCSISQLKGAVDIARSSSDSNPLIVVLFHSYDFIDVDADRGTIDLDEFSETISCLASQDDIRLLSISQAANLIGDISPRRFILNKMYYSACRSYGFLSMFLPSIRRGNGARVVYREESAYRNAILMIRITAVSISAVSSLILSVFALIVLFRKFISSRKYAITMDVFVVVGFVILLTVVVYTFHQRPVRLSGMLACSVAAGVSIGLCVSRLYLRKRLRTGQDC